MPTFIAMFLPDAATRPILTSSTYHAALLHSGYTVSICLSAWIMKIPDVADGGRGKSEFSASANSVAGLEEGIGRPQRCTAVVTDVGVATWTLNRKDCGGYEVFTVSR
jgi:hypothetical protein